MDIGEERVLETAEHRAPIFDIAIRDGSIDQSSLAFAGNRTAGLAPV